MSPNPNSETGKSTGKTQLMTFSEWYDACLDISDEFMKCNKECEYNCREKCEKEIIKKYSKKYGEDKEAILFCAYVYMSDLLYWL